MTHRPLLWVGSAFAAGITAEGAGIVPWESGTWLLIGALAAFPFFLSRRQTIVFIMLVIVASGGVLWGAKARVLAPEDVARVELLFLAGGGSGIRLVRGEVLTETRVQRIGRMVRRSFLLRVDQVCAAHICRQSTGRVQAHLYSDFEVLPGQYLELKGTLHALSRPPGSSFVSGNERRGITMALSIRRSAAAIVLREAPLWSPAMILGKFRRLCAEVYDRYLLPGEAGLMKAFMLGQRQDIPSEIYGYFRKTGTAHIVAISGLNVSILAGIFMLVLAGFRIERRWRLAAAILLVAGYAQMTGAEAPVTRAALMSGVMLLAYIIQREQELVNTLFGAGWLMLMIDPVQLFEAGFQLSFACVLAIVLMVPVLTFYPFSDGFQGSFRRGVAGLVLEGAMVSAVAWAGSAGILACTFGTVTPIGLLANIPVVPLASLMTVLGAGLVPAAVVCPPLAWLWALALKAALNLMVALSWVFSLIPGGNWVLDPVPAWAGFAYYIILVSGMAAITRWAWRGIPGSSVRKPKEF